MKAKHNFIEELNQNPEETVALKEPFVSERKMLCHVTVYPIRWGGDAFQGANVFIDHCCKENEAACNELFVQQSDVPTAGRESKNFLRVLYRGQPVDECPFCGAKIEVVKVKDA